MKLKNQKTELNKELNTFQFLNRPDKNQQYVRDTRQMQSTQQMIHNKFELNNCFEGYQSRYPLSYQSFSEKNIGHNLQKAQMIKIKKSPTKQNQRSFNQRDQNLKRNRNLIIDTNLQKDHQYIQNQNYVSNSPGSFISSPYIKSNYLQKDLYTSNNYSQRYQNLSTVISPSSKLRQNRQLQKLVSELKLSLEQSVTTQSRLQQQLNKEKIKSFQLTQIRRRLEQDLNKVEFELQKITNNDLFGQRELMVKYQNQIQETQRINIQLCELKQELKKIKIDQRQLMTQNNNLKQQIDLLRGHNNQLTDQISLLLNQMQSAKNQNNQSIKQKNIRINGNNNIKKIDPFQSIPTQKSIQDGANHSLKRIDSYLIRDEKKVSPEQKGYQKKQYFKDQRSQNQSIEKQSNQQQNDQNIVNSKLVEDYKILLQENQFMKKLYKQFYQHSPRTISNQNFLSSNPEPLFHSSNIHIISSPSKHQQLISFSSRNMSISQVSDDQKSNDSQNSKLKTFQKKQIEQQIFTLRQQVIQSLILNYYNPSIDQAKNNKANVLIIFIKLMTKNIPIIQRMVLNYLQARDLLKKELNLKKLPQIQQGHTTTQHEIEALKMWENTKQKLKAQLKSHYSTQNNSINTSQITTLKINAYFLGLFRLLTLLDKYENKTIQRSSETLSKIKHSALKYVHKQFFIRSKDFLRKFVAENRRQQKNHNQQQEYQVKQLKNSFSRILVMIFQLFV